MYYRLKTDRGCVIEVVGDKAQITELTETWHSRYRGQCIPKAMLLWENFTPDYFRTYLKQVELL